MKQRIINILILLTCFFDSGYMYAQANHIIKGRIINASTSQSIPFCNVSVTKTTRGAIANENGEFQLNVNHNDSLCFSAIGYKSATYFLNDLLNQKSVKISLAPSAYSLAEISVKPAEPAKEILKKAIKNIPLNYSTTPFISEGFYREYTKENDKYARLIEAEVEVYDQGYPLKKPKELYRLFASEDFKIKAVNKSTDYIHCFPEVSKINHLNALFSENPLRYYDEPLAKLNKFVFTIDSTSLYDNEMYYSIRFNSDLWDGTLLINTKNYSILSLKYTRKYKIDLKMPGGTGERLIFNTKTFSVNYRKYQDILTMSYISFSWGQKIVSANNDTCKIDYYTEFMSTDINTTNPIPFNTENTMDKKKDLYIQYNTFNESLFKDGTILYPTELQNKIEQDLKER